MELLLVICASSKCLTSVFPMLPVGTGMFSTPRAGFHALRLLQPRQWGWPKHNSATLLLGLGEPKGLVAVLLPVVFISTQRK